MNSLQSRKGLYTGCVLAAGALWGFIGIFVRRFTASGLTSMQVVICRAATTAVLLAAYLAFTDRKKLRIAPRDIWLFALMGLCSVTAFNGSYFNAILRLDSMSVASVLLYTSPVFVTVLSAICFHEKITPAKWGAVALTFLGCVLVSGVLGSGAKLSADGVLLGICAGLTYALYSIFGELALRRGYHPLTIVFYMWLFGLIFTLPFGQVGELVAHIRACPSEIGMYFLFGLLSAALPYVLYTLGLQHISPATAAVIATTEPCVASLVGVAFYGESVSVSLFAGIAAVIASVLLINRAGHVKER